jgi:hypothetical protein
LAAQDLSEDNRVVVFGVPGGVHQGEDAVACPPAEFRESRASVVKVTAADRHVAERPYAVPNHVRDRAHGNGAGAGAKAYRGKEEPLAPGLGEVEAVMPPKLRQ